MREGYSRLVDYANAVEYIFNNRFSNFNTIKNSFPIVTWDTKLVEVHILLYKFMRVILNNFANSYMCLSFENPNVRKNDFIYVLFLQCL